MTPPIDRFDCHPQFTSAYFCGFKQGSCHISLLSNVIFILSRSSMSCCFLLSTTPWGLRLKVISVPKTQTPATIAQTLISSLKASEYVCLTACNCAAVIVLADVCKVASWSAVIRPANSRRCVTPNMAVDPAIPMLPPKTRTCAMIP